MICYFSFFLLVALIKRERSADARQIMTLVYSLNKSARWHPKKEKSSARLEFVGILKQERREHFSVVLASKFHNSMPKIRSLSGSTSLFERYKPKACCTKACMVFFGTKNTHMFSLRPVSFAPKEMGHK